MFEVKSLSQILAASCVTLILAACGSGEPREDSGPTIDDSGLEIDQGEVATAPLSAPDTVERVSLIARFRDAASNHCPFYKESIESSANGDLAGARIQMCTGKFSQTANFGLITNLEGGPYEPGTVLATMGANGEAGAFDPLWSLIGELAQMNEAEVSQLRQEMPAKLRFAGNLYSVDYEPLMTTRSGVQLSFAGNKLQPGTLTVKIDPPS